MLAGTLVLSRINSVHPCYGCRPLGLWDEFRGRLFVNCFGGSPVQSCSRVTRDW
jgi:hypothetical protein